MELVRRQDLVPPGPRHWRHRVPGGWPCLFSIGKVTLLRAICPDIGGNYDAARVVTAWHSLLSLALQGIIFTAGAMWYFLQAINIPIHVQEVMCHHLASSCAALSLEESPQHSAASCCLMLPLCGHIP